MITPRPCGSSSKTNVWKKSSVLCRKKLVKNVFILFCLFEHIFNQSLRFASSTKSCLRGPELGFNRPIFAIIFLHRIVIRTPKMVREDTVVPLVITSHMSDWINSASWAAFLVSALALRASLSISNLLFKAAISALCAWFSVASPLQSLLISEMCACKRICQLRNGQLSSILNSGRVDGLDRRAQDDSTKVALPCVQVYENPILRK